MDPSVSPKDEIWFLLVCHHISTGLYFDVGRREKANGKDRRERKDGKESEERRNNAKVVYIVRFCSDLTHSLLTSKCLDKIESGVLGTDKIYAYFKTSFVISVPTHHSNCPISS